MTALILWPPAPTGCARPDTGTSCPASSIISPSGSQPSATRAETEGCQGSSHPPRAPWSHRRNSTSCPRLQPPGRPHCQRLWERPRTLQAVRRFVRPWVTPHKSRCGSDPPSLRPGHTRAQAVSCKDHKCFRHNIQIHVTSPKNNPAPPASFTP